MSDNKIEKIKENIEESDVKSSLKRTNSDPIESESEAKKEFKLMPVDRNGYSKTFIEKPFWIKGSFYEVLQPIAGEAKKVSSFFTILSIWNTMIGSSTVTMPNCVEKAGLVPTVCKFFI